MSSFELQQQRPRAQQVPELPPLIQEFLAQRGLKTRESMMGWTYPTLKGLRSPFLLKDMQLACQRLLKALKDQEVVAIYGDYDLDGTSGVALLNTALSQMGFSSLLLHQPQRLKEGYGLHPEACEQLAQQGAQVILTVDVGITGREAAEKCRQLGVDLIITDHHLPEGPLPEALAVVNPNQPECSSGLGHLCGTGVAFYLCLALLGVLRKEGQTPDVQPKEWLDMVALATITDMVPLVAENRVLVKHGLETLRRTQRVGLRKLLSQLDYGPHPLSARDVGFGIAPKLNALSRLETGLRPLEVYLEDDANRAFELVQKVLLINQERKQFQAQAESRAELLSKEFPWKEKGFVWVYDSEIHQGVVGLVASKLAGDLGVPAFVGSPTPMGSIVASARRPEESGVNLVDALAHASESLTKFGGHAPAAGFELSLQEAPRFQERLTEFFSGQGAKTLISPSWSWDLEVTLEDLNPSFMRWLSHLEPFGVGFEPPLLKLHGVKLARVQTLKGKHLRLTFQDGSRALGGIWFSPGAKALDHWREGSGQALEVLGELSINRFRGTERLQFSVQDMRPQK